VMGPRSRPLLEALTDQALDDERLPFGRSIEMEIGAAVCRVFRVSFVGELGFEIYVPVDQARHAFDQLWQAGQSFDLKLAGMHALDSCRLEKKFVHYGHDVTDEDTPLECGLRFVLAMEKASGFIGKQAIARQIEDKSWKKKRLVQFRLGDPEAILYHHEPIIRDGKTVGHLSSGSYGHTLGGAVGLGYVHSDEEITPESIQNSDFSIDVAGVRVPAQASLQAMYDPSGERMRR
jgi:glycine cleavage system aminomethyltransferase T